MKYRNNPANIRFVKSNKWLGLVGFKNGFCEFDTFEHGLRALVLLLRKYIEDYKLKDVSSIINRFAPPSENDTPGYVRFVVSVLVDHGLNPNEIELNSRYVFVISKAICMMETHTYLDDSRSDYVSQIIND